MKIRLSRSSQSAASMSRVRIFLTEDCIFQAFGATKDIMFFVNMVGSQQFCYQEAVAITAGQGRARCFWSYLDFALVFDGYSGLNLDKTQKREQTMYEDHPFLLRLTYNLWPVNASLLTPAPLVAPLVFLIPPTIVCGCLWHIYRNCTPFFNIYALCFPKQD